MGAVFISKPLVLLDDNLTINASAPHGEVRFQLTDMESRPVAGFTFDDCIPMASTDSHQFPMAWKAASLKDVRGRIIRLEVQMRHSKLFAIHGGIHFIDAQDRWMIDDGQAISV